MCRGCMQVLSPFGQDDLVQDWDMVAKIWDHAFRQVPQPAGVQCL